MNKAYDCLIIGAGPAGLTAGIYATRYALKTIIIGKPFESIITHAWNVENYPGFKEISGMDLIERFKEHAHHFGVELVEEEVVSAEKNNEFFLITTDANKKIKTKTIILAMGSVPRKLNVPNEEDFIGKGVSYCATCDAPFFKDKVVAVVGGSDSAVMTALLLSQKSKKVYILYRREKLRAHPIEIKKVNSNEKIEVVYNAQIKKLVGRDVLEKIELTNGEELSVNGVFVEIGRVPNPVIAKNLGVKINEQGFIIVDEHMRTNIKRVYSAGDICGTKEKLRQVITAAAEGAKAARSAYEDIEKNKK